MDKEVIYTSTDYKVHYINTDKNKEFSFDITLHKNDHDNNADSLEAMIKNKLKKLKCNYGRVWYVKGLCLESVYLVPEEDLILCNTKKTKGEKQ